MSSDTTITMTTTAEYLQHGITKVKNILQPRLLTWSNKAVVSCDSQSVMDHQAPYPGYLGNGQYSHGTHRTDRRKHNLAPVTSYPVKWQYDRGATISKEMVSILIVFFRI